MSKKNSVSKKGFNFFHQSQSNDPLGNIFAAAANMVANHGLNRLSLYVSKKLGLTGNSPEDKIAQKRSRLLDLEVQEKELRLERVRRQLENTEVHEDEQAVHLRMEPISGALEVVADPAGLSTIMEERIEAYLEWLDSMKEGHASLILGKRGSGKTALMAKIAEYLMAVHRMPTYWIGAPKTAQELVPHWIKLVDSIEDCPTNSFAMIDEAGIGYLSLRFNTSENKLMRMTLMIARQKHISLAFAAQSSRDVDYAIVRQADTIIFKEPGLHQPESERPDIKPKAKKAASAFKEINKKERIGVAYVFNDDFQGLIKCSVPSFWSEDLSHCYAQYNLSKIGVSARRKEGLQTPIDNEPNILSSASLEQEILELSQQGNGIEKVAKLLGCTVWTVRKCLDKNR